MPTKIEWVRNEDGSPGYTWNPITGCLHGCAYCYARKLAKGRLKSRYLANKNIAGDQQQFKENVIKNLSDPFYPRFWEGRIGDLDRWGYDSKPHGVFVCDMGDLFGLGVPEEWIRRVLGAIDEQLMRPNKDRFYLLTKQPQNLAKWSPFPDNCWVGVTATNNEMFEEGLWQLQRICAVKVFVSLEPLLGPIDVRGLGTARLDWLIIGQQTPVRKSTMPRISWIEEIVSAADKVGCKLFLKDNLLPLFEAHGITKREDWTGLRQEFP